MEFKAQIAFYLQFYFLCEFLNVAMHTHVWVVYITMIGKYFITEPHPSPIYNFSVQRLIP